MTSCSVENARSTGASKQWDYFQAHLIYKGVPIYGSYDMHVNFYPSGNGYFHWSPM